MSYTPSRKIFENQEDDKKSYWMVTFADLLALIITFFVLLYSMSTVIEDDWKIVSKSLSQRLNPSLTTTLTHSSAELSVERVKPTLGNDLEYLFTVLTEKMSISEKNAEVLKLSLLEDRIIISLLGDNFFSEGSATLPQTAMQVIYFLGQTLSTTKNHVEIVSYADPRPIQSDIYPSNWELSLNRAISVSNALRKSGYPYRISSFGRSSSLFGKFESDIPLERKHELSRRIDIIVRSEKATF